MAGMQPIRWDNIDGGGIAQAGSPMMNAASLFSNAFGNMKGVLDQAATTDAANWQVEKKNNTNTFLNSLYAKYTNPDDLQAAIKSGDVAKQLAGYGNQIDSDAVRGAAEARLQSLQQQGVQRIAYQNAMRDDATAADVDKLAQSRFEKDPAKAAQMAAEASASLTQKGYRHFGDQAMLADQHARELVLRTQEDQKANDAHLTSGANITHMANQDKIGFGELGVAQSNAQVNKLNAALSQRQFGEQMTDKYLERDKALRGEAAAYATYNNPLSVDGITSMNAQIKASAPDPETEVLWRQAALEAAKQPGATVGSVLQTVMGMDKNRWYKSQLWQLHNAGVEGANNAASDSNKALVEQSNSSLGRVRQQLENHATALQTNQASNWGLPSIPGLTGGTGGTVPTAMAGVRERPMGPSSTITPPGSMPQQTAVASQMDRDPVVQAAQAGSKRVGADAAAGKYGPNGYIGDNVTPAQPNQKSVMYAPPPLAQAGDDPAVKALQSKLEAYAAKAKTSGLSGDEAIAEGRARTDLRNALKAAGDKVLADARARNLKKLNIGNIIDQASR